MVWAFHGKQLACCLVFASVQQVICVRRSGVKRTGNGGRSSPSAAAERPDRLGHERRVFLLTIMWIATHSLSRIVARQCPEHAADYVEKGHEEQTQGHEAGGT